jgi:hypothetical protein
VSGWSEGTWGSNGWGGTLAQTVSGSVASGNTGTLRTGRAKSITGASAAGRTGNLGVKISVALTGNNAAGASGTAGYAYWTKIVTSQTPNWTPIISI